MSVEIGLAVPAIAELCLKYGKELKNLCSAFSHADAEISERILRLDNGWLRFTHQLNFLRRVQHMMEEDHRDVYEQTLQVFLGKLENVTAILRGLLKHQSRELGPVSSIALGAKRTKYAFKKENLDKAIEEFETWQRTADTSWFLIMKMADPEVDLALADATAGSLSIADAIPSTLAIRAGLHDMDSGGGTINGFTLDIEELSKMSIVAIPYSLAMIAQRTFSTGQVTSYILNDIQCRPLTKYHIIKKDARDLVRKLQHKDPSTFGLLTCKGLAVPVNIPEGTPESEVKLTIIFRVPTDSGNGIPRSLRDILINTTAPKSLTCQFDMARELAKSVSYVHTFGFVHKNIRPESVLSFTAADGLTTSAFLVGFENFRREYGSTQRLGDDVLDRNLYRHPSRQGASPRDDYIMQHDIYSLGVCLLEIGFWKSFVEYNAEDGRPMPTALLGLSSNASDGQINSFLQTSCLEHLLFLARSQLPQYMGTKYAEIVETCLTCLDLENTDFGDAREFEDKDGIRVGARYIEKVVFRLNKLYV